MTEMEHTRKVQFQAPAKPPRIEFDPSVMGWYVRFKTAKVARTVSEDAPGCVYAIDLDARGGVIGFELVGVKEFSLKLLKDHPSIDFSRTDFDRATFVPASKPHLVER